MEKKTKENAWSITWLKPLNIWLLYSSNVTHREWSCNNSSPSKDNSPWSGYIPTHSYTQAQARKRSTTTYLWGCAILIRASKHIVDNSNVHIHLILIILLLLILILSSSYNICWQHWLCISWRIPSCSPWHTGSHVTGFASIVPQQLLRGFRWVRHCDGHRNSDLVPTFDPCPAWYSLTFWS